MIGFYLTENFEINPAESRPIFAEIVETVAENLPQSQNLAIIKEIHNFDPIKLIF